MYQTESWTELPLNQLCGQSCQDRSFYRHWFPSGSDGAVVVVAAVVVAAVVVAAVDTSERSHWMARSSCSALVPSGVVVRCPCDSIFASSYGSWMAGSRSACGAPFRRIPFFHSPADGAEDPLEAAGSPCPEADELLLDKSCPGWFLFISAQMKN